ncbi:MAG: hypothetical protein AB7P03_14700 [Kofleriaceae bacterium]
MKLAALAGVLALAGCSLITDSFETNDFSGDPFPTIIDTSTGAVLVGMKTGSDPDAGGVLAVVDVLSPVTVIDPGPNMTPSITTEDLLVLGATAPGGPLTQPRARFAGSQLISLHPCAETDTECLIGSASRVRPYQAIIGADALAGDAVRLRLGSDQMFVLPDISGPSLELSRACDGVFPSPYRGGGTLVIGGTELSFSGRRIAIEACLGSEPLTDPVSARGTDVLLVMSTGIGSSILGRSAFERYRELYPMEPALTDTPDDQIHLPSGVIVGWRRTIKNIALVAGSSSASRAPCRQVHLQEFLRQRRSCIAGVTCPCEDNASFCAVPAVVELAPPVSVLVVADDNDTLQALRTELRPDQPEVDGILGTDVLRQLEVDIDYPNDRVVMRCLQGDCTCAMRPELASTSDRDRCPQAPNVPPPFAEGVRCTAPSQFVP